MDINQELLNRLDLIAAKLGETGTALWGILLYQAKIEAYTDMIWGGMFTLIAVSGGVTARYAFKKLDVNSKYNADEDVWIGCLIIGVIVLISFSIMGIIYLKDVPTELLNPGYWVLIHLKSRL